jgi:hypothetical protein
MFRHHRAYLALCLAAILCAGASAVFAQAASTGQTTPPAGQTTPPKTVWVNTLRGTAEIQYLKPAMRLEKDGVTIITTIQVKNMSTQPIVRLTIEEFWYDKANNPVSGDKQFLKKPLMPGEIGTIVLQTPKNPTFNQNRYKFSHQYGDVKPKLVTKF